MLHSNYTTMDKNKKYLNETDHPHPHLGNMIAKVMQEKRLTKSHVARKMNISPSTMAKYLENQSIQFGILWRLCLAIEYDFLSALITHYPAFVPKEEPTEAYEKIKDLEKEIAIYKNILKVD